MKGLAIVAAVFVAYSLVASRLDRLSVTPAIVFVATGLILGVQSTGLLPDAIRGGTVAVELTLAVLLFADASTVRLVDARADARVPIRLLLIGLPLTIVVGTLLAKAVYPTSGWATAALIATILSPTDSALGLAVYTDTAVPVRIRRSLNLESGLNDGLVTPFFTLFLAVVVSEDHVGPNNWGLQAGKEIGLAVVAAVVIGGLGGWMLTLARRRGWMSPASEQLAVLSLALLSYAGSVAIGGNGFVAAFGAGIVFGRTSAGEMHKPVEFTETVGLVGSFVVWLLFGALLARPVLTHSFHPRAIVYAALSLTVVRMLPVALSLLGLKFRRDTLLFMGWFGPRGLASVVFTLIAVEDLHHAAVATDVLVEVVVWTVLLSVLAHGLSARPLARAYAGRLGRLSDLPELEEAPEPRMRRRNLSAGPSLRAAPAAGDPS